MVFLGPMNAERITTALARLENAMTRIEAARGEAGGGAARAGEIVDAHERLRAQVSESLRELDELLAQLEEQDA